MLFALGAASAALDAIQSLTSSATSSTKSSTGSMLAGCAAFRRPSTSVDRHHGLQRRLADLAGHHEGAAGGAKPVIIGHDIGADQPVGRAAGSVLADRRQWRRPDHQVGIRKRARRRRHQHRAGRQRVQQARHQWRRHCQPQRIVGGVEGQGRRPSRHITMSRVQADRAATPAPIRCLQALQGSSSTSSASSSGSSSSLSTGQSSVTIDLAGIDQRGMVLQFAQPDDAAQRQTMSMAA